MNDDKPKIVMSAQDVQLDDDYARWIAELKYRYRSAQVKAAVRVNSEKLQFNWELGRDLVQKKAEERWGSGVVEQVSLDLRREFPDADGFSARNLSYMKQWYLFYTTPSAIEKLQQLVREIPEIKLVRSARETSDEKLQQPVAELQRTVTDNIEEKLQRPVAEMHHLGAEFPLAFALVPWGQHIDIVAKCKNIDEALFYVRETIENGLSRAALLNCIKSNLYQHKGKIANNFTEHLPALQSHLVQEVLKENYDFGFATVSHSIYDEHELEEALSRSITDLLLEMGNGFAFLGRQRELITGRTTPAARNHPAAHSSPSFRQGQ